MGLQAELRIDSRVGEITRAREWLIGHARIEGFSEKEVYKLGLAMSEACANIIKHAYGGQPGNPIDLRLVINRSSLILAIEDRGEKFDLAGYAPPDLTEPHEGGYGVFIIRSVMDEVDYDTSGQRGTILTLVKRRLEPEPEDSVG